MSSPLLDYRIVLLRVWPGSKQFYRSNLEAVRVNGTKELVVMLKTLGDSIATVGALTIRILFAQIRLFFKWFQKDLSLVSSSNVDGGVL